MRSAQLRPTLSTQPYALPLLRGQGRRRKGGGETAVALTRRERTLASQRGSERRSGMSAEAAQPEQAEGIPDAAAGEIEEEGPKDVATLEEELTEEAVYDEDEVFVMLSPLRSAPDQTASACHPPPWLIGEMKHIRVSESEYQVQTVVVLLCTTTVRAIP